MLFQSQHNLHFPITVTELLKQPGDAVRPSDHLFVYVYTAVVVEDQSRENPEGRRVEKRLPAHYECASEGTVKRWCIAPGDVIRAPAIDLVEIDETCSHSVQFGGMCADCGKDMTEVSHVTSIPDTARADTSYAHIHGAFRISKDEATRVDREGKRRLIEQRKLSLVVDLDLTIIQATVDPTIGDWQRDPSNPNYEAVKDVRSFELYDESMGRNVAYYVKLRPGLLEFLQQIKLCYELHIYTMGTRHYANKIRDIVDPDHALFGDRILSRSETPGEDSKNLRKLFPVDTKMCVIIDDRFDVWRWSPYLVRVTPYNFFVGIGDINASFLPKREDILPTQDEVPMITPTKTRTASKDADGQAKGAEADDSALEQFVSMRTSEDIASFQQKTTEQDEALAAQVNERPLLQQQKMLEEEAAREVEEVATLDTLTHEHTPSQPVRGNLLKDDDDELSELEQALKLIHRRWYEAYDERNNVKHKGANGHDQSPGKNDANGRDVLKHIPDVKNVIEPLKRSTLMHERIAFSGVIPLNRDIFASSLGRMVLELGGQVQESVDKHTTYLIARPGEPTSKMRKAASNGIPIVTVDWLYELYNAWWKEIQSERYTIEVPGVQRIEADDDEAGDDDDDEDDGAGNGTGQDYQTDMYIAGRNIQINEDDLDLDLDSGDEGSEDFEDSSDDDDDDGDGDDDDAAAADNKKRKRGIESDGESQAGSQRESRLQKRKRKALSRTSSLNNMVVMTHSLPNGEQEGEEHLQSPSGDEFDEAFDEEMQKFGAGGAVDE